MWPASSASSTWSRAACARPRNRVRVTVQLIDAQTDRHVWADRYDRELEDIFAIQDEVTAAIVATLPGRVEQATHDRAERKPTDSMVAYELVLAGKVLHHRSSPEANAEALQLLERALALDPKYAHAHAWKACVLGQTWVNGWCEDREATWARVVAELQAALALDDNDSDVHRILAAVSLASDDHERALYHQERGLALNPNNDLIVVQQGELLTWLGRPEEGIEWIRKAMRLNPYHPERFWNHLGRAYFVARRYAEAIEAFLRITRPDATHHAFLAAAHAQLDNAAAAASHAAGGPRARPRLHRRELPRDAALQAARRPRAPPRGPPQGRPHLARLCSQQFRLNDGWRRLPARLYGRIYRTRIIHTGNRMALSIRDPETDRLARELARLTGVTMTEAIRTALRERLARERSRRQTDAEQLAAELMAIGRRCAGCVQDDRPDEAILGYDEFGLPS